MMNNIKIIDNCISESEQAEIAAKVIDHSSWSISDDVIRENNFATVSREYEYDREMYNRVLESEQFVYLYNSNKDVDEAINKVINRICLEYNKDVTLNLNRIKCNYISKRGQEYFNKYSTPHTDSIDNDDNKFVAIYYVNDTDGCTILFDGDTEIRIKPNKGRLIVFPNRYLHCNEWPVKSNCRIVLNFNFTVAI